MSTDYRDELQVTQEAVAAAGKVIMKYYEGDYHVEQKGVNNPVTTADFEADSLLKERLTEAFPDYGWLSEESKDQPERLEKELVWVVDPLYGTEEFIYGVPEFVVSVGLVRDGEPVLGVLYNPVHGKMYAASKGQGAYLNGDRIRVSDTESLADASLLVSRTESKNGHVDKFADYIRAFKPTGSVAYKLCLAAAARGDLFVSVYSKNEWDVCAGHLVVNEAGGVMSDIYGEPVTYNRQETKIRDGIIAGNKTIARQMQELVRELNHQNK